MDVSNIRWQPKRLHFIWKLQANNCWISISLHKINLQNVLRITVATDWRTRFLLVSEIQREKKKQQSCICCLLISFSFAVVRNMLNHCIFLGLISLTTNFCKSDRILGEKEWSKSSQLNVSSTERDLWPAPGYTNEFYCEISGGNLFHSL